MRRYDICAVVKDPGGTNNLLPTLDELAKGPNPPSVLLVANGKAVEQLRGTGRDFITAETVEDVFAQVGLPPRVLLTSMCSGGGVGRDLAARLRGHSTVIAVQDFWGQRLQTDWAAPACRPDRILVNDKVGKRIVLKMWEGYAPEHVDITGFANLDQYASADVNAEAAVALARLGLPQGTRLVLFAGQGIGSAATLAEVAGMLGKMEHDLCLVPRPHPRTKENFASDMVLWQRALAGYHGRVVMDWFDQVTTRQLVAACAANRGVVISMFSTTLIEAAAMRAPAISVMYPEFGQKLMREEMPGLKSFPLVDAGSVAPANDQSALWKRLWQAVRGDLALEPAQAKQFTLDGKNAERAAGVVLRCLAG